MKRWYVLVEGQTEETFVRELLVPHYSRAHVFITPIVLSTSPGHKGGVTGYGKVKRQIVRLCRQDRDANVSTLIDLYALPDDFPGKSDAAYPQLWSGHQKAEYLETQLRQDVDEPNFLPHLVVHEFEAMLFAGPDHFASWADSDELVEGLKEIARGHATPEEINDDPLTAPSKRIMSLMPSYEKALHGPLIAVEIGLDALRNACPHFDAWLTRLEQMS